MGKTKYPLWLDKSTPQQKQRFRLCSRFRVCCICLSLKRNACWCWYYENSLTSYPTNEFWYNWPTQLSVECVLSFLKEASSPFTLGLEIWPLCPHVSVQVWTGVDHCALAYKNCQRALCLLTRLPANSNLVPACRRKQMSNKSISVLQMADISRPANSHSLLLLLIKRNEKWSSFWKETQKSTLPNDLSVTPSMRPLYSFPSLTSWNIQTYMMHPMNRGAILLKSMFEMFHKGRRGLCLTLHFQLKPHELPL